MGGWWCTRRVYNILKHNVIYVEQFQHFSALTRTCNKGFINHRDDEKERRWWMDMVAVVVALVPFIDTHGQGATDRPTTDME